MFKKLALFTFFGLLFQVGASLQGASERPSQAGQAVRLPSNALELALFLSSCDIGILAMSAECRAKLIEDMFKAAVVGDMEALDRAVSKDSTIVNETYLGADGIRGVVLQPVLIRQDCQMLRYLFSKGARWDLEYKPGCAIAERVVTDYSVEIMSCFIEEGRMPINHRFGGDDTALHIAANTGRADMVRYLLRAGASPVMRTTSSNLTAPLIASFAGHIDVVKAFCEYDPGLMGTFFHREQGKLDNLSTHAVLGGKEAMLDYLLRNGDSIAWTDYVWDTLSQLARLRGRGMADIVQKYRKGSQNGSEVSPVIAQPTNEQLLRERIAAVEFLKAQRVASAGTKEGPKKQRLGTASDLLRPRTKAKQSGNQELPDPEPEQGAEQVKSKKKKKKKKNKIERKYDGCPAQASAAGRDLVPLVAERDDSAAWERCAQWVQEQEATDRSAELVRALLSFKRGNSSTYEWPRDLILDRYVLVEEDQEDYGQLYDTVYDALFNFSGKQRRVKAAPTSASSGKQQEAKSAGAHKNKGQKNKGQKNGGQKHGAGKKTKRPEKKSHIPAQPGWERRVLNPAIAKAPSIYDRQQYNTGYVDKETGAPKQQAGDYVPERDAEFDNLDGQDEGESGDYRSSSPHEDYGADAVRFIPGAAGEDMLFYEEGHAKPESAWPHAQLDDGGLRYSDDGGAVQAYGDGGEQYPAEFAQHAGELGGSDDSDAKAQAELAAPLVRISLRAGGEVVWHRKHAVVINLEDGSGFHLDPNNELEIANNLERRDEAISRERNGCYALLIWGKIKSFFPPWWTVQDLTNRFVRAIQSENFTVTEERYTAKSGRIKTRTVLVGVMEPEDFLQSERPVHFMARMVGNTNMIGTVFPITKVRYQEFKDMGQSTEEKDDQALRLSGWGVGTRASDPTKTTQSAVGAQEYYVERDTDAQARDLYAGVEDCDVPVGHWAADEQDQESEFAIWGS